MRMMGQDRVQSTATPNARPRVLVIDDEPLMGTTLEVTLGDRYDVAVVQSGRAARGLLEEDASFDAILCDLMMPEFSGMDLHRWLLEHRPALAPRVVYMTGGAYTEDARSFLERVAHVEKPFDVDDLLDTLQEVVDRHAVEVDRHA